MYFDKKTKLVTKSAREVEGQRHEFNKETRITEQYIRGLWPLTRLEKQHQLFSDKLDMKPIFWTFCNRQKKIMLEFSLNGHPCEYQTEEHIEGRWVLFMGGRIQYWLPLEPLVRLWLHMYWSVCQFGRWSTAMTNFNYSQWLVSL